VEGGGAGLTRCPQDRVQIAIHHKNEGTFSDRWVEYCAERHIPFTAVDCYRSDILRQLASADALLWHFLQTRPANLLMARHVVMAAEAMGLKVFPSSPTCWHFDDKIAQKYLLEAVGAPLIPTYVSYDPDEALRWIDGAVFPKVFKLRRGAGSENVRLVRTADEARRLAARAFGRGFRPAGGYFADASTKYRKVRARRDVAGVLRRLPRAILDLYRRVHLMGREKGYVYFQDFAAGNTFDTRITIIGNRAFGFTRNVRQGDFRASGSGSINYDLARIKPPCVEIAFQVARKIGSQSIAFDFVMEAGEPKIVEISYCYLPEAVYRCAGHWDDRLDWHEGQVWPQDAIIEDLLTGLK